jgi:hypothetical protein
MLALLESAIGASWHGIQVRLHGALGSPRVFLVLPYITLMQYAQPSSGICMSISNACDHVGCIPTVAHYEPPHQ